MGKLRWFSAGLWAAAGVFVGHDIAYRLVYPDAHQRAHALTGSGHGWLSVLLPLTVLFGAGAVASTIIRAWSSSNEGHHYRRVRPLAIQSAFQLLTFLLLEVGERLVHAGSLSGLQHELSDHGGWKLLAIGALVQLFCALGAALLASGIESVVASLREPKVHTGCSAHGFTPTDGRPVSTVYRAHRGRAPPSCALA